VGLNPETNVKITKAELLETIAKLGPHTEADWTAEGLPSVDRVRDLALDDTITREDITLNANGFDREVAASALLARDEVTADDQTKLDGAKPLGEAAAAAAESVSALSAAPGEDQTDDERRVALQAAVNAAVEDLGEFDVALSKQRQMRDAMVARVDEAKKALEAEFPPLRHADIVQQWLASEARKRMERGGRPADIDQRFRRPTGYGNRRPSVPPVATHA